MFHKSPVFLFLIVGVAPLCGQVLFTFDFDGSTNSLTLETDPLATFNWVAIDTNMAGATTGDRLQLSFSNEYGFQELVPAPTDWSSFDIADGLMNTTRTYYFTGIDEFIGNENYNFVTPFTLSYDLIPIGPGPPVAVKSISYVYSATEVPSFTRQTETGNYLLDTGVVPEPGSYALMLGAISIAGVVFIRFRKRTPSQKQSAPSE